MKKLLLFVFAVLLFQTAFSQKRNFNFTKNISDRTPEDYQLKSKRQIAKNLPLTTRGLQASESKFQLQQLQTKTKSGLSVASMDTNRQPVVIKGELKGEQFKTTDLTAQCNMYLEQASGLLKIQNPVEAFELMERKTDDLNFTHLKFQQKYKGLPIYGAEAILHEKEGAVFMLNGRTYPTPSIENVTAQVADNAAIEAVKQHLAVEKNTEYQAGLTPEEIGGAQETATLKIYFAENEIADEKLVWHIVIHPNRIKRFEYFVDANTGKVIDHFSAFCQITHHKFEGEGHCNHNHFDEQEYKVPLNVDVETNEMLDGPATASAIDLNGVNRTVNTYNVGTNFFMIDASKDMHRENVSTFPNDGVGVIWTIDGQNGTPVRSSSFRPTHVVSSNNAWSDRRAVSAHFNGEFAYDYFRNVHGRLSINDEGGNVLSFYNISEDDGSDMDNAFWNGQHIYYGNGDVAFNTSLAASLDVAGHEMSHGVVQTTANLTYRGESGALNESFADIFAALMDRDDWQIGEDIVNPQIFRSGALRDLSNPNNGGTNLNDAGFQPDHYDERFTGSGDNGGVHINSGIPNHAFYWFTIDPNVGRERAELVFFRALDNYLVASSQFIDFRAAVAQSAMDLYGADIANIAHAAMDRVGIPGGAPNDHQDDLEENPGNQFMMLTNESSSAIFLADETGNLIGNPFLDQAILSSPSISDDGSFAVFVGADGNIYEIDLIENTFGAISTSPIWRNAAISRDGNRVAALSDEEDNGLFIFNFVDGSNTRFELINPTFTQGIATGDVVFADILEWDFTGEWVMYDALNRVQGDFGEITYWDIGFVNVFDQNAGSFAAGDIQKLYSLLPENVSVGNPTFAKVSPFIIAFDFIDDNEGTVDLLTANLQTGDVSDPPIFQSDDLLFPNFRTDDSRISFNAATNQGDLVVAQVDLTDNKLAAAGNAEIFIDGGRRGVWFANGQRVLSSTEDADIQSIVNVFPNPSQGEFTIAIDGLVNNLNEVEIYGLLGEKLFEQTIGSGENNLNLNFLSEGTYFVSIKSNGQLLKTERVVIIR